MSVLPEHLCTNSLSLIMSAHPILQVLDKEIRKARGGGHRKWRERAKSHLVGGCMSANC